MISVSGAGHAAGTPDVVRVGLTATGVRPTAAEAVSVAEAASVAVRAVLERYGISGAEAASATFTVRGEPVHNGMGGPTGETRYRCEHRIHAVLGDVAALGPLLTDVLTAGGDAVAVTGVEPGVRDPAPLRARARALAWADAADRAAQLAGLAGRGLGPVVSIVEDGPHPGLPRPQGRAFPMSASLGGAPLDVRAGDVEVQVTLAVEWELA